jgi:cytidylate kinase
MIVTIDGPSGVGKSTAARELARRLHFAYLDTGAMYRALALFAERQCVSWEDADALGLLLPQLPLEVRPGGVIALEDCPLGEEIRTRHISQGASRVARYPAVRSWLADMQRQLAEQGRIVCEGRDQGTVVFPKAGCKFFLTAELPTRVARRAEQLRHAGQVVDLEQLTADMAFRDEQDRTRKDGPLRKADDAELIDSTNMSFEQVLDRMETVVRRRLG